MAHALGDDLPHRGTRPRQALGHPFIVTSKPSGVGKLAFNMLMQREGEWIGIGVTNLLLLYSPERLAIGGGVSQNMALLEPHIRRTVDTRVMPPFRDVPIAAAQLGDNAGVIGAAASLVVQNEFHDHESRAL